MKVSLEISVSSPLWRGLRRARAIARGTIAATAAESGGPSEGGDVSLCLANDAALRALNLRWRGIDKPTNVLSFPSAVHAVADRVGHAPEGVRKDASLTTGYRTRLHLGDIALAYETLAREADDLGLPLADHYRHLLAHGFLHLIGYDHQTDAQAARMEALETRILARLGAGDPYAREAVGG
jgi:probable rRNA maturation factor